jgi:hypothetical protein
VLLVSLAAYFGLLEAATRTVVPRLSQSAPRESADRAAALGLRPATADGAPEVLIVGNSLLLSGVSREALQARLGAALHVTTFPIENTNYWDWYFGLRRLFAGGMRPSAIAVMLSARQLMSDGTNGESFAHTMMRPQDLLDVARASHLDATRTTDYLFALGSSWFARRSGVRNVIIEKALPNSGTLARYLSPPSSSIPDEDPLLLDRAIRRLGDLQNLCAKHGARFVYLVPATANERDPAPAIKSAAIQAGIATTMPYAPGEMPPDAFSDGFHLNPRGAALFTERLASVMPVVF